MFQEERQQQIVGHIKERTSITVNDLSRIFNVSEVTIRRDLEELERSGMVKRTHGGAMLTSESISELTYKTFLTQNREEKKKIGKKAAELITDGSTVFFEASTTVLEISKNLSSKKNLTIVTNSPHILIELAQYKNINKIVSMAGRFNTETMSINGPLSEQVLSEMNIEKTFLGLNAIDSELNISSFQLEDAELKQALIKRSKEVIGTADFSKFGKKYFAHVSPITALSALVVEGSAPREYLERIEGSGVKVIVAE